MQTGTILERFPAPPSAALPGWTMLDRDAAKGWIRTAFEGRKELLNFGGFVRLGKAVAFLEAALGDASGAVVARATSHVRLVPGPAA